jgi:hypothetical protein
VGDARDVTDDGERIGASERAGDGERHAFVGEIRADEMMVRREAPIDDTETPIRKRDLARAFARMCEGSSDADEHRHGVVGVEIVHVLRAEGAVRAANAARGRSP